MSFFPTSVEVARMVQLADSITAISTDTEPAAFAGRREYLVDTSGGSVELTLPAALACDNGAELIAVKTTAANTLTVTPASGDTVNGATGSITLTTQYAAYHLQRITTGWLILTAATP